MKCNLRPGRLLKIFKCDKCSAGYKSLRTLHKHIQNHNRPDKVQCKICMAFYYTAELPLHIQIHTGPPYNCPICLKKFVKINSWVRHFWCSYSRSLFMQKCFFSSTFRNRNNIAELCIEKKRSNVKDRSFRSVHLLTTYRYVFCILLHAPQESKVRRKRVRNFAADNAVDSMCVYGGNMVEIMLMSVTTQTIMQFPFLQLSCGTCSKTFFEVKISILFFTDP